MSLFESTFRWIGAAIFTVLVPGTVTAFLPYYILDPSVPEIGAWGPLQLIASTVLVVGASIYFRCLWDFVVAGHGLPAPVDHPKKLVVSGLFSFYYKTFARLALLPYIGGTVIHIVRLIYNFPLDELPWQADWLVVLVGGYAGLGLIIYANRIPFKNLLDKMIYGLLIFHLDGSVILHTYVLWVGSHDVLNVFPYWYSFIAVGYFLGLGYYVLILNRRLYPK